MQAKMTINKTWLHINRCLLRRKGISQLACCIVVVQDGRKQGPQSQESAETAATSVFKTV